MKKMALRWFRAFLDAPNLLGYCQPLRPVDLGLAVHDFGEHGDVEEVLEDHAVGDAGGVAFVVGVIEDDASAGETAMLDVADGEQGVVEAAELVVHDDDDRQLQ